MKIWDGGGRVRWGRLLLQNVGKKNDRWDRGGREIKKKREKKKKKRKRRGFKLGLLVDKLFATNSRILSVMRVTFIFGKMCGLENWLYP